MSTSVVPAARPSLRQHLRLAVGALALVTLGAFLDRAVGTALPSIVSELDALAWFGAVNAAPAASYIVALALAGTWADRRGPLPALRLGVVVLGVAQALVGLAPGIAVVVLGRLLSGAAEALIDVSLVVLVARAVPSSLRPRMFSLFAAAWVLPSVVGPVVTGLVTEQLGWRWVFLGAVVLLLPTWLLLRPALAEHAEAAAVPGRATSGAPEWAWAVVCGAAVLAVTVAGQLVAGHPAASVVTLVVAVGVLGRGLSEVLPRGTLRAARGLPALVAVRALVSVGFGTVGGFLPLLLTVLHGFGPTQAGVSLTVTGLAWAAGSWLQGRDSTITRVDLLRIGMALLTVGLTTTTLVAVPGLVPWWGLVGWAVAGVGIGIASATVSVLVLDLSAPEEQGRNTGATQLAASASLAIGFAVGGALVGLAAPAPGAGVFLVLLVAGATCAAVGLAVTGRVTSAG
jgi:MFS family permease